MKGKWEVFEDLEMGGMRWFVDENSVGMGWKLGNELEASVERIKEVFDRKKLRSLW
jgi:hypothetical protein